MSACSALTKLQHFRRRVIIPNRRPNKLISGSHFIKPLFFPLQQRRSRLTELKPMPPSNTHMQDTQLGVSRMSNRTRV